MQENSQFTGIRATIRSRHSTRRYTDDPVAKDKLDHLLAVAAGAERVCHSSIRTVVVNGRERVDHILARYAGVYGLVQGAPHLLVALLPQDQALDRLDLGYVLEQVVLEATRLELATCWMTGTYYPDQAAREVGLREGEIVGATVSLGYARQDRRARLHDKTIRQIVAGHRRKPLEKIVFGGRWGERWSPEGADPTLVELLTCAQLAPSAHNGQPWRFVIGEQEIALALTRSAPIDGGIVMSHVTLAARDMGRAGQWTVRWGDPALASAYRLPPSAVPVGTFSSTP